MKQWILDGPRNTVLATFSSSCISFSSKNSFGAPTSERSVCTAKAVYHECSCEYTLEYRAMLEIRIEDGIKTGADGVFG